MVKVKNGEYSGHRRRVREKLTTKGVSSLTDLEILEYFLFSSHIRQDVKPVAKRLLKKFGSFSGAIAAPLDELMQIEGIGQVTASNIVILQELVKRVSREKIMHKHIFKGMQSVIDYVKVSMQHERKEQLRLLLLNNRNELIFDEVVQEGSVDSLPLYSRDITHLALNAHATGAIVVHNHPSGDSRPSNADIDNTLKLIDTLKAVKVTLHDHIIIGKGDIFSFSEYGFFQ